MIPVSTDYLQSIYADVREFRARTIIQMEAFTTTKKETLKANYLGKVSGSFSENPHIAKYVKSSIIRPPNYASNAECTDLHYDRINVLDGRILNVTTATANAINQSFYSFDIIALLERQYGKYIWQGKELLADKITIAKTLVTNITCNWHGWGYAPNATTPTEVEYLANMTYWMANTSTWNSTLTKSTASTVTKVTRGTSVNVPNMIDSTGFCHYIIYGNPSNGTMDADLYTDFVELTVEVTFSDLRYYDDNTIIRLKSLEEISILNDTVPSNELEITLDNSNGEFNILTLSNMHQIIASKPTISAELGLVKNLHKGKNGLANPNLDIFPTNELAENWSKYSVIGTGGGSVWSKANGITGNAQQITVTAQSIGGINSGYDYANVLPSTTVHIRFLYKGPEPNYVYLMKASGNQKIVNITTKQFSGDWYEAKGTIVTSNTAEEAIGLLICLDCRTIPAGTLILDDIYMSNADYDEYVEEVEWIPIGKYFVSEWKNDITNKIITFIGNDYFTLLGDTNYDPVGITNLRSLAIDVLTKGGIPTTDQIIDTRLSTITSAGFPERLDMRTALQQIGIASQSCVYQDRYGNVVIQPFLTLDKITNYILYPRTQNGLPMSYPSPSTYPIMGTGSGMRYLDYDQMFEAPQVGLEKSIYQLVVKVYSGETETDYVYTNPLLEGNNGLSFTIDNKLVNSSEMADEIAEWYFNETNYNAVYSINWRQNPALECTDLVLIEDPFHANKQTRIIRQEFNYEGYLDGVTESRGGV